MSSKNEIKDTSFTNKASVLALAIRFVRYCLSHKKLVITLVLASSITSMLEAVVPYLLMHLIDGSIVPSVKEIMEGASILDVMMIYNFLNYLLIFIAITIVVVFLKKYMVKGMGKLCYNTTKELRMEMFVKLQNESFSFHDRTQIGWYISRITNDSKRLGDLLWAILFIIGALIKITATITVMLMHSISLSLLLLSAIPLFILSTTIINKFILKHSRKFMQYHSEMYGNFIENINSIELIKTSACENYTYDKFKRKNKLVQTAQINTNKQALLSPFSVSTISAITGTLFILFGGKMAFLSKNSITIGTYGAFFAYARSIFDPIAEIIGNYQKITNSISSVERIFSFLDSDREDKKIVLKEKFGLLNGNIEFRNVNFGYTSKQKILENFSLKIQSGESVALAGPSGEGKTTIINLICQFYKPLKGTIYIDNIDYTTRDTKSLLEQIGYISQVPYLFSGTIRENILMGQPNCTDVDIYKVFDMIGAPEISKKLSKKVEAGGDNLSSGEKQFISFAKALIKKPKILIMDEATSSVDAIIETKIRDSIKSIIKNKTAIIVAHRLSTIIECDRILFIKGGEIIEEGNHKSLIEQKGQYYNFYKSFCENYEQKIYS